MGSLYIISGVTGMTGNELARKLTSKDNLVIGFDNFFASSLETVKDILDKDNFLFYNYDKIPVDCRNRMNIITGATKRIITQ